MGKLEGRVTPEGEAGEMMVGVEREGEAPPGCLMLHHIVLLALLHPHPKVPISRPLSMLCFLPVVLVPLPLLPAQILPTFPDPDPRPRFSRSFSLFSLHPLLIGVSRSFIFPH